LKSRCKPIFPSPRQKGHITEQKRQIGVASLETILSHFKGLKVNVSFSFFANIVAMNGVRNQGERIAGANVQRCGLHVASAGHMLLDKECDSKAAVGHVSASQP
jgi:hypothetical protein